MDPGLVCQLKGKVMNYQEKDVTYLERRVFGDQGCCKEMHGENGEARRKKEGVHSGHPLISFEADSDQIRQQNYCLISVLQCVLSFSTTSII